MHVTQLCLPCSSLSCSPSYTGSILLSCLQGMAQGESMACHRSCQTGPVGHPCCNVNVRQVIRVGQLPSTSVSFDYCACMFQTPLLSPFKLMEHVLLLLHKVHNIIAN